MKFRIEKKKIHPTVTNITLFVRDEENSKWDVIPARTFFTVQEAIDYAGEYKKNYEIIEFDL